MQIVSRTLDYYLTPQGKVPFRDWYYALQDQITRAVIRARLTRVERGLLGDAKSVGGGVWELRIHYGPGYRVYFGQEGRTLIWLLGGGDKRTQHNDIPAAQAAWAEFLRRKAL